MSTTFHKNPVLYAIGAERREEYIQILPPEFSIGRHQQCNYSILHEVISEVHCIFQCTEGKWILFDKSTNGTFVNGRRTPSNSYVILEEGYVLKFGPFSAFVYVFSFQERKVMDFTNAGDILSHLSCMQNNGDVLRIVPSNGDPLNISGPSGACGVLNIVDKRHKVSTEEGMAENCENETSTRVIIFGNLPCPSHMETRKRQWDNCAHQSAHTAPTKDTGEGCSLETMPHLLPIQPEAPMTVKRSRSHRHENIQSGDSRTVKSSTEIQYAAASSQCTVEVRNQSIIGLHKEAGQCVNYETSLVDTNHDLRLQLTETYRVLEQMKSVNHDVEKQIVNEREEKRRLAEKVRELEQQTDVMKKDMTVHPKTEDMVGSSTSEGRNAASQETFESPIKVNYKALLEERENASRLLGELTKLKEERATESKNLMDELKDMKVQMERAESKCAELEKSLEEAVQVKNDLNVELENRESRLSVMQQELLDVNEAKDTLDVCIKSHEEKLLNIVSLLENELLCSVCSEILISPITLKCKHTFCEYCITEWKKKKRDCPMCRMHITQEIRSFTIDNFIEKMMDHIGEDIKQHRDGVIAYRQAAAAAAAAEAPAAGPAEALGHAPPSPPPPAEANAESDDESEDAEVAQQDDDEERDGIIYLSSDSEDNEATTDVNDSSDDVSSEFSDDGTSSDSSLPGPEEFLGPNNRCYLCGYRGHWPAACPH